MTTGYNIREGSSELARRADAARRQRIADLARLALFILDNRTVVVRFTHTESRRV